MPSSGRTDFRKHNRRGGSGLTETERFWQKVDVKGPDECWLWVASVWGGNVKGDGYGQFRRESGSRRAHVVAYELSVGPVPDRHDVHHTCEVKLCCNPRHLEAKPLGEHRGGHTRERYANMRRNGLRATKKGAK